MKIYLINIIIITYLTLYKTIQLDNEQLRFIEDETEIKGKIIPKEFDGDKDPIDRAVIQALSIYLNKQNSLLLINRVIDCKIQIEENIFYYLTLEVEQNLTMLKYEALVEAFPNPKSEPYVSYAYQIHENELQNQMTQQDIDEGVYNYVLQQIYRKNSKYEEFSKQFTIVTDFQFLEKQIMSGIQYTCKVLLINPKIDFMEKNHHKGYKVQVLHKAWNNEYKLISLKSYEYTKEDLDNQVNEIQEHQMYSGWIQYEKSEDKYQVIENIQNIIKQELQNKSILNDFEILNMNTQIASGLNFKVHIQIGFQQEYEIIIYYQPWRDFLKIVSFQQIETKDLESIESQAIINGHNGGWSNYNLYLNENQQILELSQKSIKGYLQQKNIQEEFEIVGSEFQIVSGINLKLVVRIQNTLYNSKIYLQPWNNYYKIISFESPNISDQLNLDNSIESTNYYQKNKNKMNHDDL